MTADNFICGFSYTVNSYGKSVRYYQPKEHPNAFGTVQKQMEQKHLTGVFQTIANVPLTTLLSNQKNTEADTPGLYIIFGCISWNSCKEVNRWENWGTVKSQTNSSENKQQQQTDKH